MKKMKNAEHENQKQTFYRKNENQRLQQVSYRISLQARVTCREGLKLFIIVYLVYYDSF